MIIFRTHDGRSPEEGLTDILNRVAAQLDNSGKIISQALTQSTKRHVQTTYPGSKHWSPEKIHQGQTTKTSGSVDIGIAGATRAFHDLNILPKLRRHLTIPMHRDSYGKRAADFPGIFRIKKKSGKMFLAQKDGKSLKFLFYLAPKAFQRQDRNLLPDDRTYAQNIFARIYANLRRQNI